VNYVLEEPKNWVTEVAGFPQEREDRGSTVTLKGRCPRCHHSMTVELPIEDRTHRKVSDARDNELLGTGWFVKVAFCNCGEDHPHQPADRLGCGAFGALKVG
jgi:hypothetical protein